MHNQRACSVSVCSHITPRIAIIMAKVVLIWALASMSTDVCSICFPTAISCCVRTEQQQELHISDVSHTQSCETNNKIWIPTSHWTNLSEHVQLPCIKRLRSWQRSSLLATLCAGTMGLSFTDLHTARYCLADAEMSVLAMSQWPQIKERAHHTCPMLGCTDCTPSFAPSSCMHMLEIQTDHSTTNFGLAKP